MSSLRNICQGCVAVWHRHHRWPSVRFHHTRTIQGSTRSPGARSAAGFCCRLGAFPTMVDNQVQFLHHRRFFSDKSSSTQADVKKDVATTSVETKRDDEEGRTSPSEVTFNVTDGYTDEDEDRNTRALTGNAAESGIDISKYTHEVEIRMPDMDESESKIVKWYKSEGDIIRRNDTLCDIETPDFTFGMDTDDEGITVMGKIIVPEGTEHIKDGEVICTVLHKEDEEEKQSEETS